MRGARGQAGCMIDITFHTRPGTTTENGHVERAVDGSKVYVEMKIVL